MAFNSFLFLGFFALVGTLYGFIKRECRWIFLLVSSLFFVIYSSPKGVLYLLLSSIVTYICTIQIDKLNLSPTERKKEKKKKIFITIDIVINLGILFMTKYLNFFGDIFSKLSGVKYQAISQAIPMGISFYTFMILGYAIDVYRENYRAQRNFGKMLLFASYFPQLVDGPISRYDDVQASLFNPADIEYKRCRDALVLFTWGLFKKLCIADNIAIYINMIYGNYQDYHGIVVFSGAVAYALFLYADFSGCIDMARGISKYFGIDLKENFDLPYLAESVDEFWRRWHITLSTWFKDYLFYPILRSKKITSLGKKLKKKGGGYKKLSRILPTTIALLIVWLFVGLWHGAKINYIVYGLYYGLIIITSNIFHTLRKGKNICQYKWLRILCTFVIVCFGYMIFNSTDIQSAAGMMRQTFSGDIVNITVLKNLGIQFYKQVGGKVYFIVTVISSMILIIYDFLKYFGIEAADKCILINKYVKYILAAGIVFFLLFMMNRTSGDFTYMQF